MAEAQHDSLAAELRASESALAPAPADAAAAPHASANDARCCAAEDGGVRYMQYAGEAQLQDIIDLISVDLSEPYSIFTCALPHHSRAECGRAGRAQLVGRP